MQASTGAFITVIGILLLVIFLGSAIRMIIGDVRLDNPYSESTLQTQEDIQKQLHREKLNQDRLMRDMQNQQRAAESRNKSN